jgi:hypothetical protein
MTDAKPWLLKQLHQDKQFLLSNDIMLGREGGATHPPKP